MGNDTDNSDSVVCHADLDTCCILDLTMETGISLMELDCHSLVPVSLLVQVVQLR